MDEISGLQDSISKTCDVIPLTTISSVTKPKTNKRRKVGAHPATCLSRDLQSLLSPHSPGDVLIRNPHDVAAVYSSGVFGRGSVSKGAPTGCLEGSEHLVLSPCEAMYLVNRGDIQVLSGDGQVLSPQELWVIWRGYNSNYPALYALYRHYRDKGYVVRSGLKYGGHYAIYTGHPNTTHAGFVVRVQGQGEMDWSDVIALRRVSETVGKEAILGYANFKGQDLSDVSCLDNVSVLFVLLKRWIPERGRELESK